MGAVGSRTEDYDLAIVGAGIVGLGHAVAALERGLRVIVVERQPAILGASVRNFGHVGTSVHTGTAREYAELTRERWLELAARAAFWVRESGVVIVARADDEMAVLEQAGHGRLLSAREVADLVPVSSAVGGMRREADLQVDPREAAPAIARYLADRGVEFRWRTAALGVETGALHTSRGLVRATAVVVAINADVDGLFPELADEHGIERCGLDMLLADGVGLRMPVLTATSMLRYAAFASTDAATALRARLSTTDPELFEHDVNQMYTERPDGTLIVGDTHHRGAGVTPFQGEAAFRLLERLGGEFFGRPLRVRERWQGVYASAPHDFLRAAPADGVRVVSVTTGIGMTTGLGLAESVVRELFGDARGLS